MLPQQFPFNINTLLKSHQASSNTSDEKADKKLFSNELYRPPPSMFRVKHHLIHDHHPLISAAAIAASAAAAVAAVSHQNFDPQPKEKRAGHPYQSRAPPKHKKPRTSFTKDQVTYLENRFVEQKYLASSERARLAGELDMSDAQVKTWFQNRRTKWRRQEAEEREYAKKTTSKLLSMTAFFPRIIEDS